MNIFKILASGDGRINEPNVSAFLAYLLDPKADHGIGDELVKRLLGNLNKSNGYVLKFLLDANEKPRDLSVNSNFIIEVLLEQAFTLNDINQPKQIVDIVILCYEKKVEKKESLAKMVLSNNSRGDLRQIVLIENKIRDEATTEKQLIKQCESTIKTLVDVLGLSETEIKQLLSIIFITPNGAKSSREYQELHDDSSLNIPKYHIKWSKNNEMEIESVKEVKEENVKEDYKEKCEQSTMLSLLKHILRVESFGDSDAINEITKYTLKSFIAFVENGFKSSIEEEREGRRGKDVIGNYEEFRGKYSGQFSTKDLEVLDAFQKVIESGKYDNLTVRYSKTQPISILFEHQGIKKKIFDLSKTSSGLKIQIVNNNHYVLKNNQEHFLTYLKDWKFPDASFKDYGIEVKSNQITCEDALQIFDKQYNLISTAMKQI